MVCLAHCRQELQQKSWKLQDFFFKTKTKTFIFVLEAPRDQDPGLEDYIAGWYLNYPTDFYVDILRYLL